MTVWVLATAWEPTMFSRVIASTSSTAKTLIQAVLPSVRAALA